MGTGLYSSKLSYENWYNFNNAVRAHQNFLEFLPMMISFLLIAGIYFPIPAASLGLVLMIARIIYAVGYTGWGPAGRLPGFFITLFSVIALGILGCISSVFLIVSFEL